MPAIYLSFEIEPGMTPVQKQERLYLALVSAGESAYTLGAAIAELRKQVDAFDKVITNLRKDVVTMKEEIIPRCPRCNSQIRDGLCKNYGCESGL